MREPRSLSTDPYHVDSLVGPDCRHVFAAEPREVWGTLSSRRGSNPYRDMIRPSLIEGWDMLVKLTPVLMGKEV